MQRLAVHRYDDPRLRPVDQLADLVAARVPGRMDESVAVGDHFGAEVDQRIDDRVHRPLVAGDGAR
jgi:hypothetical protein